MAYKAAAFASGQLFLWLSSEDKKPSHLQDPSSQNRNISDSCFNRSHEEQASVIVKVARETVNIRQLN